MATHQPTSRLRIVRTVLRLNAEALQQSASPSDHGSRQGTCAVESARQLYQTAAARKCRHLCICCHWINHGYRSTLASAVTTPSYTASSDWRLFPASTIPAAP